jgi:SAM-dependent methyltransferase
MPENTELPISPASSDPTFTSSVAPTDGLITPCETTAATTLNRTSAESGEYGEYQRIYEWVYEQHPNYGSTIRAGSLDLAALLAWPDRPIVDVGCGSLAFLGALRSITNPAINLLGIDVVQPLNNPAGVRFARCPAWGLADVISNVGVVCCFDVLEHLTEDDLPRTFAAWHRAMAAGAYLIATIACRPSSHRGPEDQNLHLTIRPAEWWRARLSEWFVDVRPAMGFWTARR